MNNSLKFIGYVSVAVISVIIGLSGVISFYSVLGIFLFLLFSNKFFFELGEKIEVRDLMILIALLQWIVGPTLAYTFYPDDPFYYMAVDEETYMGYVFPASLGLIIGLYLPIWRKPLHEFDLLNATKELLQRYPGLDLLFVITGVLAELFRDNMPASLRFFFVLVGSFRFVGIYFLTLSDRPYKTAITVAIIAWLAMKSINEGMFHDLLLWLGFMLMIFSLINQFSLSRKLVFFLLLGFTVLVIQTVKHEFRLLMYSDEGTSRGTLFTSLVQDKLESPDSFTSDVRMQANVNRINQGWIVARIMAHTPRYEPFAEGETIRDGIEATLLPRFLKPDKAVAGGRTYFTRFTGKDINDNTSMGLSPLGEAYANFGISGGVIFMALLGLFYNFFIHRIFYLALRNPSLILWMPMMFLQVVKAETDFAVVLNHLIKASVVVWMAYFGLRNFLGIKI